jgi:hypothetical protein
MCLPRGLHAVCASAHALAVGLASPRSRGERVIFSIPPQAPDCVDEAQNLG